MEKDEFEKYLKDRYYDQIKYHDTKSLKSQRVYNRFQWSIIIFSAVSPVLITIFSDNAYLRWLPITTSLIVAILAAAMKSFSYQENWINNRSTCEALKKEIYFYEAGLGDYAGATDKNAVFVERVENVLSKERNLWLQAHQEETKKQNKASEAG